MTRGFLDKVLSAFQPTSWNGPDLRAALTNGAAPVNPRRVDTVLRSLIERAPGVWDATELGGVFTDRRPASSPAAPAPISIAQLNWLRAEGEAPVAREFQRTPFALVVDGPLEFERLARAIETLQRRHGILTTAYSFDGAEVVQTPGAGEPAPMAFHDVSERTESEQASRIWTTVRDALTRPYPSADNRALAPAVFRLAADQHVLALVIDHIAIDDQGVALLLADLFKLYESPDQPPLAPADSYATYARKNAASASRDKLRRNAEFWRQRTVGVAPLDLRDPALAPYPKVATRLSSPVIVERDLREAAFAFARECGVTMPTLIAAAFGAMFLRLGRRDQVLFGCVVDDRPPGGSDIVGAFIRTAPLFLDMGGDPTARKWVGRTREAFIDALDPDQAVDPRDIPGLTNVILNMRRPGPRLAARLEDRPSPPMPEDLTYRRWAPPRPFIQGMTLDLQVFMTIHPGMIAGRVRHAPERTGRAIPEWIAATAPAVLARLIDGADEPMSRVVPGRGLDTAEPTV